MLPAFAIEFDRRIIRAFPEEVPLTPNLLVNHEAVAAELPGDTPLLWLLRDHLNLSGT